MAEIAEKSGGNVTEEQKGDKNPSEVRPPEKEEGQRSLLEHRISGVNRDKRIEAALLFISGFQTSPTRLAEKFGVAKNSILRWKKKDGWLDLRSQTDQITRASLPTSVAAYRLKFIRSLEADLELIDRKKEGVKPNSLEGLLKAKAALQGRLHELLGIAQERDATVTIVFGGYGEAPAPRGAVRIPGKEVPLEGQTPGVGALGNVENTGDSEVGTEAAEAGMDGSIEILRGDVKNKESAPEKGAASAEGPGEAERADKTKPVLHDSDGGKGNPRVALRGRSLPGGKTETKEGLTLEEAMS